MLNDKELIVYKTICNFINEKNYCPTIRELCCILNYKSTKTVYNYIKKLKEKNYINYYPNKKRAIVTNDNIEKQFTIINTQKKIHININNKYVIYQIKNNFFENYFIKKNDYLIINIEKKIKNNDLGLFLINNEYKIMKYNFIDGYYVLEDNNKEILNRINLIGIVESIYRIKI